VNKVKDERRIVWMALPSKALSAASRRLDQSSFMLDTTGNGILAELLWDVCRRYIVPGISMTFDGGILQQTKRTNTST